ncbi:MAG: M48 family metallopeptidase [Candidatus Binatus sp.]|uniref:M48 family metallopeptidase n=1 Tax=Candidatus Binatus sp. TaxID=2811406 RepID=UPI00271C0FCE|nr:M48 family metallopeptidase [Candidatus Binatus sp.]MDO8434055.1 M48 family metallopeptidase [Candidatus Binatus sp.]
MAAASNFRALEATNRRETAILIAVFMLLFGALGLGLDFAARDLYLDNGRLAGFPALTIAALLFGSIQSLVSFYGGASLVLLSVHARPLTPDTQKHQMVLNVINEMAIAARMPAPKPYLMDDPSPNAFATGRDPQHSVICVTQGLVDNMDREELQGVIGHEMSHIADYDIRTMMMIAVMVGGIAMLSDFVYRWMFFGGFGGRDRDDHDRDNNAAALITVAVVILAAVAPLFSQLLAMAVSRQREYLADASSVEFTRNPRALLRALQHIAQIESPLKAGTAGTAHLFMVNPREGMKDDNEGFLANLFSSHPPLQKRIERLQAMLGAPSAASIAAEAVRSTTSGPA